MARSGTARETGEGPWTCQRQRQRQARQHRISEALYGSYAEEASVVQSAFMASAAEQVHVIHTKQSHRLSPKVWFVLAKSLGIKMHTFDKPVFGTVLYILTLLFAIAFSISHTWFIVYDIVNIYTRQTVLTGLVTIAMVLYWCALGVYANQLASKLFNSPKFVASMRMHTRTVFKVSAAGILVAVGGIMTLLTSITASQTFSDAYCHNVSVSVVVCKVMFVSRVGYSVFSLVWNLLVGIVLLSVCRTHTIGIRRLISEFEADGRLHEYMMRERNQSTNNAAPNHSRVSSDVDDDLLWDDENISLTQNIQHRETGGERTGLEEEGSVFGTSQEEVFLTHRTELPHPPAVTRHTTNTSTSPSVSQQNDTVGMSPSHILHHEDQQTMTSERPGTLGGDHAVGTERPGTLGGDHAVGTERPGTLGGDHAVGTERLVDLEGNNVSVLLTSTRGSVPSTSTQACNREVERGQGDTSNCHRPDNVSLRNWCEDSASVDSASSFSQPPPHIVTTFTIDDILIRYWKISTRLRTTSMALQRWLVAWVFYILLWSGSFIMYWVSHDATLMDISQFILPILLLPLVCSAFAEVNNEGIRMVKCICPTEERVHLLFFLLQQPLELTAFGFAINYSTIVTALGALGLAFCSRIILDEMKM